MVLNTEQSELRHGKQRSLEKHLCFIGEVKKIAGLNFICVYANYITAQQGGQELNSFRVSYSTISFL